MPFSYGSGGDAGGFSSPSGGSGPAGGAGGAAGGAGGGGGDGGGVGAPVQQANRASSTGLFIVTRQTADRVEFAQAFQIGANDIVTITPIFTNTVNCFYSTAGGPDAAKIGPRIVLAPAANPRPVKVRNLNEIGVYSTVVGEGVSIDVQFGER